MTKDKNEQIRQEYLQACVELGNLEYQASVLQDELESLEYRAVKVKNKMQSINKRGSALAKGDSSDESATGNEQQSSSEASPIL